MWFPPMKPSDIVGRNLWLIAQFLGVAMVAIDGAVFSGPIFRSEDRFYLLHAEQDKDNSAAVRFVDIGENATHQFLAQSEQIKALAAEVVSDRTALASMRETIANLEASRELLETTLGARTAALETIQRTATGYKLEIDNLVEEVAGCNKAVTELSIANAHGEEMLKRYYEAVGPLDPPMGRNVNDDVSAQLTLADATNIEAIAEDLANRGAGGEIEDNRNPEDRGITGPMLRKAWSEEYPAPVDSDLL